MVGLADTDKTLQAWLHDYEARLPDLVADRGAWTHQDVNVHRGSIAFDRLYRNFDVGGAQHRLHLHRIPPNPDRVPYLHAHGQATALHVLGPGAYELGWGHSDVLHGRSVHTGPWYYEMRTGHVQHYVRVLGPEPVYSVMLWVPWPTVCRGSDLEPNPAPLVPADNALLDLVRSVLG